jgi:hypothetical protein
MGVLAAVDEQLAESIAEPPADNLDIVRWAVNGWSKWHREYSHQFWGISPNCASPPKNLTLHFSHQ